MTLSEAFQDFIVTKQADGLTRRSIESYQDQCKPLLKMLGSYQVEAIKQADLTQFLVHVNQDETVSAGTKSSRVRSSRAFLHWLATEYEVQYQYQRIKTPKMPKKVTRIYTAEDIDLILSSITYNVPWVETRNRLAFAFMLDSGMRRNEMVTLRRKDVAISGHCITVTGKGNKSRVVHVGDYSLDLLSEYLDQCPYDSEFLFCSRDGGPWSPHAVSQFFSKLQRRLPFKLSAHRLRHNFATNYCEDTMADGKSVDPNELQALMGHESLTTTKRYLHNSIEQTAAKRCPSHLDRLKKKDHSA